MPSYSYPQQPRVALVDKVVDKRGTRKVAQAYLEYLYAPEGQEIAARNYYLTDAGVRRQEVRSAVREVTLFRLSEAFGDWQKAQKTHFSDGGSFDQIYRPGGQ